MSTQCCEITIAVFRSSANCIDWIFPLTPTLSHAGRGNKPGTSRSAMMWNALYDSRERMGVHKIRL